MIRYTLFILGIIGYQTLKAQTTALRIDTVRLSVYNTGRVYELKRAPFGEQTPTVGIVKAMVFAEDSFDVKKNEVAKTFKPENNNQLRSRVVEFTPPTTPRRPTEEEIAKVKNNNSSKRTCQIATLGLKDKIVLIDFDKNCDPTFKCLQAQQGGASAVIVIYDTNKKDSIALVRGRYDAQIKIPCYSITRAQGDSVRGMLPSRVALFVPKWGLANNNSLLSSNENMLQQQSQNLNKQGDLQGEQNLLGLNKANQPLRFTLTPNPTNSETRLEYAFSEPISLTITVLNEAGQTIKTYQRSQTQTASFIFNTTDWADGFYIIRLTTPTTQVVKRLVVHH